MIFGAIGLAQDAYMWHCISPSKLKGTRIIDLDSEEPTSEGIPDTTLPQLPTTQPPTNNLIQLKCKKIQHQLAQIIRIPITKRTRKLPPRSDPHYIKCIESIYCEIE